MSLVLNMVGGSGGGKLKDTDAVLVVTVPTGSTVTATKGGTTLTPTMWVKAADASLDCAIFSIPTSQFDSTTPWTITATDGTNTASTTVLITTNKEYEVEISYAFWLYKDGIIFSDLGAWYNVKSTTDTGEVLQVTYDSGPCSKGYFTNAVPLRNYGTTLHVIASITQLYPSASTYPFRCGAFSAALGTGNYGAEVGKAVATTVVTEVNANYVDYTVDISTLTVDANYYLSILCIAAATVKQVYITD